MYVSVPSGPQLSVPRVFWRSSKTAATNTTRLTSWLPLPRPLRGPAGNFMFLDVANSLGIDVLLMLKLGVVRFVKLLIVIVIAPEAHVYVYLVFGRSTHVGGLTVDTVCWCVFSVS